MRPIGLLCAAMLLCSCGSEPAQVAQAASQTAPQKQAPLVAPPKPVDGSSHRRFPLKTLKTAKVNVGDKTFTVWIMDTEPKREEGMMWLDRSDVPEGQGMLFVFREDQAGGFWMHNTYLPLDICYVDSHGDVVSIAHGQPLDDTTLVPDRPYRDVVEFVEGDAVLNGVFVGTHVRLPDVKSRD